MEKKEQIKMDEIIQDENFTTNEVKEQEVKSYIYRFEEMKDAMEGSLNNLDGILEQQSKLIDLVKNSEEKEYFEKFIEESEKQLEKLQEQRNNLSIKISLLVQVIERCKSNSAIEETISILSDVLGLFKN